MEEKSPFDTLLTQEQLANRLGKSVSTIRQYRASGKIAFVTVNGKIKFRLSEVLRFEGSGDHPTKENLSGFWR
jgi:hypothetical protein